METTANALTTTTLIAQHLDIKDENGAILEPEILKAIINQVTGLIERYCNRKFLYTQYTEDVYDTDVVQVHALPIDRTQAIQVADKDGNYDNYIGTVEHSQAGIIKLDKRIDFGQVVYTGGYLINFAQVTDINSHTLPLEVSGIATQLCARIYEKRFSEGKSNESVEGQSITWGQFMTADDKAVLDTYRVY